MEISSVSTSLRVVSSPVRPPPLLKFGGPGINPPCGLTSPRSPTAELQRNRRMAMASASATSSATSSYGTRNKRTEEQRERQRDDVVVSRNEKQSHYGLLGVPCDAPAEEIRTAYRKLALQYHPDVVPIQEMDNATKLFSEINRAYQILSDPRERKAYDDLHLIPPKAQSSRASGFSSYPYSSSSSRAGQPRGRNWETDQCWC